MTTLFESGLAGIAVLSGLVLCWLGIYSYRRWDEPGAASFGATAVILGLGGMGSGGVVFVHGIEISQSTAPLWYNIGYGGWALSTAPWIVFALQYTGRLTEFRWRRVATLSGPVVGFVALEATGGAADNPILQIVSAFLFFYTFALVSVGGYLLLRTTYDYGHLSLYLGLSLTLGGMATLFVSILTGTIVGDVADRTVFAVYTLAFVGPASGFALAMFRYGTFDSTPAAGALGERAIPRETDDIVFVVDDAERIIKLNQTATETFEVSPIDPLGEPFESVLGRTVTQLQNLETVDLETTAGKRKFDPQVTAFTDQHGRELGTLLSLRDVTDRELRKQRLEVLNRVLRHNIRNGVDVIKANTRAVAAETDGTYTREVQNTADRLAALSSKARTTDQILSQPGRPSRADLSDVVTELADGGPTELDLPTSAPLYTDWDALRAALDAAIENAIEHAEESVTVRVTESEDGYTIVIADDGPGIPESELAALDAETETQFQHGTGLGLWQLKWGVTKVGGGFSFDTTGGTTVQITVPDQD